MLPDIDYAVLDKWFQWMMKKREVRVDLIVYLRASPTVCQSRIARRSRKEEDGIPLVRKLSRFFFDLLVVFGSLGP